jgi:hypothetical protein
MMERGSTLSPVTVGEAVSVWAIWYGLVGAPFTAVGLWRAVGLLNPSAQWFILLLVLVEGAALVGQAAAPVLGILSLAGRTSSRHAARLAAATLIITAIAGTVVNIQYAFANSFPADAIANILSWLAYLLAGIGLAVWSCRAEAMRSSDWKLMGRVILGCAALSGTSWIVLTTGAVTTFGASIWLQPRAWGLHLSPFALPLLYACAGHMLWRCIE